MDQRRLLSFILASTAFFFFYILMLKNFGVPPKPNPAQDAAQVDGDGPAKDGAIDGLVADGDAKADGDPNEANLVAADDNKDDAAAPAPQRPERPEWITLGSMAPDSNHLMMVTLNSRGGGVERIELTARKENGKFKYRRIDLRTGYLGYFAGEIDDRATGVRVNVVGPGTPAALAKATNGGLDGVQVGDVIVKVDSMTITSPEDIRDALIKSKPGDQVVVEVLRGLPELGEEANNQSSTVSLTATLSEHPLDLVRLARTGGEDQVSGNLSRLSCLMTLGAVNLKEIMANERSIKGMVDPTDLIWNASEVDGEGVQTAMFDLELGTEEMKAAGGKPVRLVRSYSLKPNSYLLDMDVAIENNSDQPQKLGYRLEGVNGVTMEGWWYSNKVTPSWSRAAARDVVFKTTAEGHATFTGCNLLTNARENPKDPDQGLFAEGGDPANRELRYIGIDAQYFSCAYIPNEGKGIMDHFRRGRASIVADEADVKRHQEHAVNSSFYLDSAVGTVPAGGKLQTQLRLFAGPKEPELAAEYGLSESIYYGWFSWFAKILLGVLHFLVGIFGNYAVAIILLTIMVRGMMFPLSRKAAVNAQRMQELAPELKKIAEEYKDDMEGRLKAQRALQARVGFNPLAGCLPMFLQLPIFIGLYRALSVDIELRQAAVSGATSWASNLAGPDMFTRWDGWLMEYFSGRGTGWLGPYFNILPVVVVVLFMAQQKLFMPPATDEQTAMTQKLMGFMTLFMGLFFFRVPAGLCLYFIASSMWGICERIVVKKTLPKAKHFNQDVIDGKVVESSSKKKVSLADRIREQMGQKEEPVLPPNKRKRPPNNNKKKK